MDFFTSGTVIIEGNVSVPLKLYQTEVYLIDV
jgi:hypothetical protein